ncbi:MAG: tyrosine-type recombinase/integrase [Proteobacteria bacterium]|nr:tyrosine-type recombinase/integrase [Pseudomonadota bacterium]
MTNETGSKADTRLANVSQIKTQGDDRTKENGAQAGTGKAKARRRIKLNKRNIDKLKTVSKYGERFYDSELPCYGIKVYTSGRKSFFIDYGPRNARRRMSLGTYGPLTPEQARKKALEKIGEFQNGVDPLETRHEENKAQTFAEWFDQYTESLTGRKRSASIKADKLYLGRAAKLFGKKKLHTLTVSDIERFFCHQKELGPVTANRALASIRTCLQSAWRRNLVAENVAMKVQPLAENPPRSRVLDDEEMKRFLDALEQDKNVHVKAAFKILLATGARRSEVLGMKYADLDLSNPSAATWRLQRPKSGRPEIKPLTGEIVELINELPKKGPYVIAGRFPFKPRSDLKKHWYTIVEKAGLEGITIHDIRRSFGLEVARSAGLHIASKLLGHSSVRITEKVYAPLGIDELRAAAEKVGRQRKAKVAKLRKVKRR